MELQLAGADAVRFWAALKIRSTPVALVYCTVTSPVNVITHGLRWIVQLMFVRCPCCGCAVGGTTMKWALLLHVIDAARPAIVQFENLRVTVPTSKLDAVLPPVATMLPVAETVVQIATGLLGELIVTLAAGAVAV
jgi:hypothetical protein